MFEMPLINLSEIVNKCQYLQQLIVFKSLTRSRTTTRKATNPIYTKNVKKKIFKNEDLLFRFIWMKIFCVNYRVSFLFCSVFRNWNILNTFIFLPFQSCSFETRQRSVSREELVVVLDEEGAYAQWPISGYCVPLISLG